MFRWKRRAQQRFTVDFKVEATKLMTEKGFAVAEVEARWGVVAYSRQPILLASAPMRVGYTGCRVRSILGARGVCINEKRRTREFAISARLVGAW